MEGKIIALGYCLGRPHLSGEVGGASDQVRVKRVGQRIDYLPSASLSAEMGYWCEARGWSHL